METRKETTFNVLITGATGFLGSRVLEDFVNRSDVTSIVATGRKHSRPVIDDSKVKYVLGDLQDDHHIQALFNHPIDVVINCASLSSPWGSYQAFHRANCLTQEKLVKASEKWGVRRYVYISSPTIYFDFKNKFNIRENHPPGKPMVNHYAATKWIAEKMLEDSQLSYIILRPRALIGRGDTVIMPRLIRSYTEGRLRIIGNGINKVDLTSVSNAVEAIYLSVIAGSENSRQAYNISNGEPVMLWKAIDNVLEGIGYESIKKRVPYNIAYSLAALQEFKSNIFTPKSEPALTRYSVGVLAKDFSFDIGKAKENLGYIPQQSTQGALLEFVEWYNTKS